VRLGTQTAVSVRRMKLQTAQEILDEALKAKERHRKELAALPIEKKLEMVRRMVNISRQAGRLPEWYERLMRDKREG
jgi:hypothetical protein